jgi:hypothetical protein
MIAADIENAAVNPGKTKIKTRITEPRITATRRGSAGALNVTSFVCELHFDRTG